MHSLEEIHWHNLHNRLRLVEHHVVRLLAMAHRTPTSSPPSTRRIGEWIETAGHIAKAVARYSPWVYVGMQAVWRQLLPYIERVLH